MTAEQFILKNPTPDVIFALTYPETYKLSHAEHVAIRKIVFQAIEDWRQSVMITPTLENK